MFTKRSEQGGIGRRRIVRTFSAAAAVAALVGALRRDGAAHAQRDAGGIVGTWIGEVATGQRAGLPIRFMIFFFREGIVQYFEAPQVPTNSQSDDPEALEYQSINAGGQWVQTGVNAYAAYTVGLDYDARGNPTTRDVTRVTISHDRVNDTLMIINDFRELDPAGNENAHITSPMTCTRVTVTP